MLGSPQSYLAPGTLQCGEASKILPSWSFVISSVQHRIRQLASFKQDFCDTQDLSSLFAWKAIFDLFVHVMFFVAWELLSRVWNKKNMKNHWHFLDKSLQWTVNSPLWKLCDVLQQSHRMSHRIGCSHSQSICRILPFATWNKFGFIRLSKISPIFVNLGIWKSAPTPKPQPRTSQR